MTTQFTNPNAPSQIATEQKVAHQGQVDLVNRLLKRAELEGLVFRETANCLASSPDATTHYMSSGFRPFSLDAWLHYVEHLPMMLDTTERVQRVLKGMRERLKAGEVLSLRDVEILNSLKELYPMV